LRKIKFHFSQNLYTLIKEKERSGERERERGGRGRERA